MYRTIQKKCPNGGGPSSCEMVKHGTATTTATASDKEYKTQDQDVVIITYAERRFVNHFLSLWITIYKNPLLHWEESKKSHVVIVVVDGGGQRRKKGIVWRDDVVDEEYFTPWNFSEMNIAVTHKNCFWRALSIVWFVSMIMMMWWYDDDDDHGMNTNIATAVVATKLVFIQEVIVDRAGVSENRSVVTSFLYIFYWPYLELYISIPNLNRVESLAALDYNYIIFYWSIGHLVVPIIVSVCVCVVSAVVYWYWDSRENCWNTVPFPVVT